MVHLGEMSRTRLFWLLQCAGWIAFGSAMWIAGLTHWSMGYASLNKGVLIAIGFVLTLGLRRWYRAVAVRSWKLSSIIALVVITSAVGSLAWVAVHRLVMGLWLSTLVDAPLSVLVVRPDVTAVLYQSFVLLAWGVLYFGINSHLDLQTERERLIRAEALAHQARLQALRSQLQPHFLFNTLNAISTLVCEGRNQAADRMIGRLSEFLRMTISRPEANEIALVEEMEFLECYLEIEKVRFGDRLQVAVDLDPESLDAMVPAMILQPLVENAVRHGILRREQGGSIRIVSIRDDGHVSLSVEDDGPGTTSVGSQGTGIGLSNTRLRLQEMYGEDAELVLERQGGGTRVAVRLPYRRPHEPPEVEA